MADVGRKALSIALGILIVLVVLLVIGGLAQLLVTPGS